MVTLIEIDTELDLPEGMKLQVFDGDLDTAKARFLAKHGFECRVIYKLRNRWWMVMDAGYEVTK